MSTPHYFVTYWGDIYFGLLWELRDYSNGFFIVPPNNFHKLHDVKDKEPTLDNCRRYGWEISDFRVIVDFFPESSREASFSQTHPKPISFSQEQFSKMFVFGAGASTYCCYGEDAATYDKFPLKSPMGFDIFHRRFHDICQKYPGVQASMPNFGLKENTIEDCLEEEWLNYRMAYNLQVAVRHINIQYYLQELFQNVSKSVATGFYRENLYNVFAGRLQQFCAKNEKQRPVLVSFNYDTLLEHFIGINFSSQYEKMDDYIDYKNREVVLFKPHGSSNWGWKFPDQTSDMIAGKDLSQWLYSQRKSPADIYFNLLGPINQMVYERSYGIEYGAGRGNLGHHSINKELIEVKSASEQGLYYPAMLLPYKDKDEFILPYRHVTVLEHTLTKIKQLFLIGWKGNEELFNRKLKQHLANCEQLIIVNPDPDTVTKNLADSIDLTKIEVIRIKNFEEFVSKHLNEFLKS